MRLDGIFLNKEIRDKALKLAEQLDCYLEEILDFEEVEYQTDSDGLITDIYVRS